MLKVSIAFCTPVSAETYTVCPSGCNFTSVQEAINVASDEDTIAVMAGTYPESIVVNKTLLITGTGGTTIIGDPDGDVSVTVEADEVTLENLTITPGRVSGVTIQGNDLTLQSLGITGYNPDNPDDKRREKGLIPLQMRKAPRPLFVRRNRSPPFDERNDPGLPGIWDA